MTATYTKLRDGSWGVRVVGTVAPGATVQVTKKSGESKTETVGKVIWTGNGVTLATLARESTPRPTTRRRGGRYECEECGDYVEPGTRCWETGMIH
jgi:hypothetical protein